jgi:uncharacterized protein YjeT (DUF2065 family)
MIDFLTALGLMFVLEGAMYALFPGGMKGVSARVLEMEKGTLRLFGMVFAVFGFLMIAVLRGF